MNKMIQKFGQTVEDKIEAHPRQARALLKAGYAYSGMQAKYFSDNRLLSHQKYASFTGNQTIRDALCNPENSAVINIFFPCELLYAMDIIPQFVEGLATYLKGAAAERGFIDAAEDAGIPKTYCSYHKTLLGAAFANVLSKPLLVLNTTHVCDANTMTFRSLADHWQALHYVIDVPNDYSMEAIDYIANQLRQMVKFITDNTGRKLDEAKLQEIIQCENRSLEMYRKYFNVLADKFIPNGLTAEMNKLFFTHILLGTPQAEQYFSQLLDDAGKAAACNGEIRILWAHTLPFWQKSISSVFNFSDKYQLLCSDMNFDYLSGMDEYHPYESLACKMLQNSMCGSAQKRNNRLLEMATMLHADGVIYFNHWGCKQTMGGCLAAKEMLERADIPTLILDGDGCDSRNINDGQMHTKLQAFLEMLEAGK